jgi:hypothetical protein
MKERTIGNCKCGFIPFVELGFFIYRLTTVVLSVYISIYHLILNEEVDFSIYE